MSNLILENREYIENKEIFIRKKYNEKLNNLVETKNIIILEGQRRVGKSSIIISYLKNLKINLDKVFYINKELDVLDEISEVSDLNKIFEDFKIDFGEPEYIIIDEIQDIDGWEKFIRKVFSYKKYKIIITGSNSKLLSGELASYLTGRYISMEIFSFSYSEFLEFRNLKSNEDSFLEYLEVGGMPENLFLNNENIRKNYIKNVVSSIILKDIVARFNVRDIKLIEKILQYLANNLGSLVSITNIFKYLKLQFKKEYSTKTIANYLRYLEFPFIVNEVSRYDLNGKKVLEYVSKYYFSDIGIRNSFGFVFSKDIGKILENLVYLKLKQDGYEVYVGDLSGNEIDFVAEKNGEKLYIQVCYLLSSENVINREFGNLLKIKDNYKKIVVSMDQSFGNTYEGIENINIKNFLLS